MFDTVGYGSGVLRGGASFGAGFVGSGTGEAIVLDGVTGQAVVWAETGAGNFETGDFSLEAWINTTTSGVIAAKREDNRPSFIGGWALTVQSAVSNAGQLAFQLADGPGFTSYQSTAFVADGQYHHVAVTVDRDNAAGGRMYVDGVVVHTFDPRTRAGSLNCNQPLRIGAVTGNNGIPTAFFGGSIDELAFFGRALNMEEIASLHDAGSDGKCKGGSEGCTQPEVDLSHWWAGDGDALDFVGTANGTLENGAGFGVGMVTTGSGLAFSLDGVDDFVSVPASQGAGDFGTADFTVDAWIRTSTYGAIATKRVDSRPFFIAGWALFVQSPDQSGGVDTGELGFQLSDGLDFTNYQSNAFVADGLYHHVAVTVDRDSPTGGSLFVDGAVVLAFDPTSRQGSLDNDQDLFIGTASDIAGDLFHFFGGSVDEVRIIHRALTANDVRAVFRSGSAGVCRIIDDPPIAVAGPDQSIHAGETVQLDGTDSFDDNTATQDLVYQWSILDSPPGSSATLIGAGTAMPTFVADLPGSYLIQLVVVDEILQSSAPVWVTVSSLNVAPTAEAGADQIVMVGQIVDLDGSASSDPDEDPLEYEWTILQAPPGSASTLDDNSLIAPTFVPDIAGEYTVRLVVRDGFSSSAPDEIFVSAINGVELAQLHLMDALELLNELPVTAFDAKGHQKSMANRISQILRFLESGQLPGADNGLEYVLSRVDGCALRGAPDPKGAGQPFAADHVVTCADQEALFALLSAAALALGG